MKLASLVGRAPMRNPRQADAEVWQADKQPWEVAEEPRSPDTLRDQGDAGPDRHYTPCSTVGNLQKSSGLP